MRRSKRFAALTIVSLGVAITLNTSMYGVLDTMIRPKLAMKDPAQLYEMPFFGDFRGLIPIADRNAAIRALPFHQGVAGSMPAREDRIAERGRLLREVSVATVTPNYFGVIAPRGVAGRTIGAGDVGAPERPVMVSERVWKGLFPEKDRFEPSVIRLGGTPRLVVGVLPYEAILPNLQQDVWQLPLPGGIDSIPLRLVRLRDGVTAAHADAQLVALAQRLSLRTGEGPAEAGFRFRSIARPPYRVDRFHYAMIGAVVAVLLVACGNLANLQLARGVARERELATRSALGATRGQIVRQLVLETGMLALAGLALAALLTWWSVQVVDAYLPPSLEGYVTRPQLSWRVGLFAVAATLLCLVLVGLLPAIRVSRLDISQALKSGAGTGRSRHARRQYGALVVLEVAMALALLTSTSLLLKAVWQVRSFEYGHDVDGLLQTWVGLRDVPSDIRTRRDWSDRLVQRALAAPGVSGAATVVNRPPPRHAISVDDPSGAPRTFTMHYFYQEVSPDYFRVTRIPIVRGRGFTPGEFAEPVVVIEERVANLFWPGLDPVGRMIKLDSAHTAEPWLRVVGVVGQTRRWFPRNMDEYEVSVRQRRGLGVIYVLSADRPIVARGAGQQVSAFAALLVRTDTVPEMVAPALRREMLGLASDVMVGHPATWDQMTGLAALRARQDFVAGLFLVFTVSALALAMFGVYAIMAHAVEERTREFGVRIAVGASQRDIRRMVLRDGNVLALTGIAVGLLLTWKNAALVRAFVFSDYDRYDSRFFAVAALVLFLTALLASYIPARRAMRINAVEALRND